MAAVFGFNDDQYASDRERGTATDLSRAYDNARAIQERTMARYGLPALAEYERNWAIERARGATTGLNRMRKAASNYGNSTTAASNQNRWAGLMRWLPMLMGKEGYQDLLNRGIIKTVTDAFGNTSAVPANQEAATALSNMSAGTDVGTGFGYPAYTDEPGIDPRSVIGLGYGYPTGITPSQPTDYSNEGNNYPAYTALADTSNYSNEGNNYPAPVSGTDFFDQTIYIPE
jgi:hypothetical protein